MRTSEGQIDQGQKPDRAVTLGVIAELPATALLTPQEAALYLATTPDVLRTWRATGRGPRFKGRGHFIRYQKAVLDVFMSGHDRD
jgi:hypothetical protein